MKNPSENLPHSVRCSEKNTACSGQRTEVEDWDDKTDPDFDGNPPSELPLSTLRAALMPEKVYL